MSPSISPPPPDVLDALLSEHAHRFPEKARLPVPGEGGATVHLPIVLGIPTGAAKMPAGRLASVAWPRLVASALGFIQEGEDDAAAMVRDCLLWPPPAQWREWSETWPALDAPAMRLIKKKIGYEASSIEAPDTAEGVTPSARGLVRLLRPAPGTAKAIAVEPPGADMWRLYLRACKTPGEDPAKHTRDVVDAVTGNAAGPLLDRYPGLVISLAKTAGYLAGAGAEGELGNW